MHIFHLRSLSFCARFVVLICISYGCESTVIQLTELHESQCTRLGNKFMFRYICTISTFFFFQIKLSDLKYDTCIFLRNDYLYSQPFLANWIEFDFRNKAVLYSTKIKIARRLLSTLNTKINRNSLASKKKQMDMSIPFLFLPVFTSCTLRTLNYRLHITKREINLMNYGVAFCFDSMKTSPY
jgi:hypothetical protein